MGSARPGDPGAAPATVEQHLTSFCQRFEVDDAVLARALKASRHLVRAAAAADLERPRFAADVALLAGAADAPRIQALLLAGYDAAKALIRAEIAQRTLAEHDDLVTRVEHRVEQILSSSHGENLGLRVLALTFRTGRAGHEESGHGAPRRRTDRAAPPGLRARIEMRGPGIPRARSIEVAPVDRGSIGVRNPRRRRPLPASPARNPAGMLGPRRASGLAAMMRTPPLAVFFAALGSAVALFAACTGTPPGAGDTPPPRPTPAPPPVSPPPAAEVDAGDGG